MAEEETNSLTYRPRPRVAYRARAARFQPMGSPSMGIQVENGQLATSNLMTDVEGKTIWTPGCADTSVLKTLSKNLSPDIGLLPPVVRYVTTDRRGVILERPPHLARIEFYNRKPASVKEDSKLYSFEIPIPWQVYAFAFNNDLSIRWASGHFSHGPIASEEQVLFVPPLPNYYETGNICLPSPAEVFRAEGHTVPATVADAVLRAYRACWMSHFNKDLMDSINVTLSHALPTLVFERMKLRTKAGKVLDVTPIKFFQAWEGLTLEEAANIEDWKPLWSGRTTVAAVASQLEQTRSVNISSPYVASMSVQRELQAAISEARAYDDND